ncbi:MAG TPA: hypothetical protein VFH95_02645 [Candidatus Kapabacteria bacterium]|nr:hypothetical protein [Candidatus Kapabacteria bacterium]
MMFREFETTIIDDQGHFDIPRDLRERKGLKKGARVKIEERNAELVIKQVGEGPETSGDRKARQLAAIEALTGFLPPDSKALDILMEERKKDREKEDRPFGV